MRGPSVLLRHPVHRPPFRQVPPHERKVLDRLLGSDSECILAVGEISGLTHDPLRGASESPRSVGHPWRLHPLTLHIEAVLHVLLERPVDVHKLQQRAIWKKNICIRILIRPHDRYAIQSGGNVVCMWEFGGVESDMHENGRLELARQQATTLDERKLVRLSGPRHTLLLETLEVRRLPIGLPSGIGSSQTGAL